MKTSYYSHGKLLLTGEYLVLDGVQSLALPTQKGQWLRIAETEDIGIHWKSLDEKDRCWFETHLLVQTEKKGSRHVISQNWMENPAHYEIENTLVKILNVALTLNPKFLSEKSKYRVETKLEFPINWGLGSSSTLINNIAQWANINAYELLEKSFGGSGYDIACAQQDTAILYQRNGIKPKITSVNFDPPFSDQLFFVHLNQKQDSKESIKHYQSLSLKNFEKSEASIKSITHGMLSCYSLNEFRKLIDHHEEIISGIIKTRTVKSRLFSDYPGSIKSLGGWGGDFVLATGTDQEKNYFYENGFDTIIPYHAMIL